MKRRFIIGIFDQEESLLKAAKLLKDSAIRMFDVFTPYPVHGLDELMGLKRSRLPIVCFFAGLSGCVLALFFQIWTSAIDWPLNVGGKPYNSLPAFIPITFELTVLIGGLVTTAAFLFRSKLFPFKKVKLWNARVTNDRFVIAVEAGASVDEKRVAELFNEAGVGVIEQEEVDV